MIRQSARLAFKRDFFGRIPRQDGLHPPGQILELRFGQERGGSASEINELGFSAADERLGPVQLQFADRQVQVGLDGGGVFIRVNAKITKVAAFSAKGDMQEKAQLSFLPRR